MDMNENEMGKVWSESIGNESPRWGGGMCVYNGEERVIEDPNLKKSIVYNSDIFRLLLFVGLFCIIIFLCITFLTMSFFISFYFLFSFIFCLFCLYAL